MIFLYWYFGELSYIVVGNWKNGNCNWLSGNFVVNNGLIKLSKLGWVIELRVKSNIRIKKFEVNVRDK